MKPMKVVGITLLLCLAMVTSRAQRGFGLRMAGQFTQLRQGADAGLVDGYYAAFVLGPTYMDYRTNGGGEIGLNLVMKNAEGGFNLPVVMRDFKGSQNTALTALELDARVGPRFGWLYPQIGALIGYRLRAEGFFVPDTEAGRGLNPLYLDLPLGVAVHLPATFGTVGASLHYTIGLVNVARNPGDVTDWQGGSQQGWRVGFHIFFGEPNPRKPNTD